MFHTKVVEKIKTRILFSVAVYHTSRRSRDNVEKYNGAGEATDKNMAHVHFTPGTYGYKHTLGICNIYCFSTATMVARTRPNVTLNLHCLS